ncbi:hypothetical protein [Lignipirellula cremea]|uniref:Uncharacterized protein n=1 Tax=Lignipirellula cremea TaxID=2528010 RepID=A0A518E4D4_9BACT|nr:hypothetical protein [Lignipirellula cremea]QDU98944.1 hypothetical protein Pla8534_68550 [Lignipirellula cremea]
MSPNPDVAATPRYVLIDGENRLGPIVASDESGMRFSPLYGFSDRQSFDTFCNASELALKPYPLVMGYLRAQLETGNGPGLIVVDAAGPRQTHLQAATLEAVLESQEKKLPQVPLSHGLAFDEAARAYRSINLGQEATPSAESRLP